jgi:hypothetical protein
MSRSNTDLPSRVASILVLEAAQDRQVFRRVLLGLPVRVGFAAGRLPPLAASLAESRPGV